MDVMNRPVREDDTFARARRGRNIAIAVGLVLFVALVYVVTNFMVDIFYCFLDPRVRAGLLG